VLQSAFLVSEREPLMLSERLNALRGERQIICEINIAGTMNMSRGHQTFKQSDVTKALKATVKAGIEVARVEIDKDGKIVIVTARPEDVANGEKAGKNEWDEVH
jgi:hypothetical protein